MDDDPVRQFHPDPTIGRIVYYVARGSADGEFPAGANRSAIITQVLNQFDVGLCILNPTGMFFDECVPYDGSGAPGTWHWPERV